MNPDEFIKPVIEAALLAAGRPLTLEQLCEIFLSAEQDEEEAEAMRVAMRKPVRAALAALREECVTRGIDLFEVAGGYRFQVKQSIAPQVSHLWVTRPSRYSRALLETLALIAYRQPITRGEIESIRGVSVSSQIMKTLLEYGWVRILGHRNTPGRPLLYGSTREFLEHFSLKGLKDLPPLSELQDLAKLDAQQLEESAAVEMADSFAQAVPLEIPTEEPAETADSPAQVAPAEGEENIELEIPTSPVQVAPAEGEENIELEIPTSPAQVAPAEGEENIGLEIPTSPVHVAPAEDEGNIELEIPTSPAQVAPAEGEENTALEIPTSPAQVAPAEGEENIELEIPAEDVQEVL